MLLPHSVNQVELGSTMLIAAFCPFKREVVFSQSIKFSCQYKRIRLFLGPFPRGWWSSVRSILLGEIRWVWNSTSRRQSRWMQSQMKSGTPSSPFLSFGAMPSYVNDTPSGYLIFFLSSFLCSNLLFSAKTPVREMNGRVSIPCREKWIKKFIFDRD